MAQPELSPEALEYGRQYDAALSDLGFNAHAVFWAFDKVWDEFVLVLLSDFVELKGPFEVQKLLFRAYNSRALPQEIDPFHVRVHSIDQPLADELARRASATVVRNLDADALRGETTEVPIAFMGLHEMVVSPRWGIRFRKRDYKEPVSNRWNRFSDRVEHLAA